MHRGTRLVRLLSVFLQLRLELACFAMAYLYRTNGGLFRLLQLDRTVTYVFAYINKWMNMTMLQEFERSCRKTYRPFLSKLSRSLPDQRRRRTRI